MGIKAVEMVREIRDYNYEATRNMSTQEYLVYIHAKSAAFQKKCVAQKPPRKSAAVTSKVQRTAA